MRQYYIMTILKHQRLDYVSLQRLYQMIELIKFSTPIHFSGPEGFEIDPLYTQMHYHALITFPRYFKYKGFTSMNGYRFHFKAILDPKQLEYVVNYIQKEYHSKYLLEQISLTKHYTSNMFINNGGTAPTAL